MIYPRTGLQVVTRYTSCIRIWTGHHYCWPASTTNQSGLVTLAFDLESGHMCDVGYLCANFSLHRPLCSRITPDVRNRQTDIRQTSDKSIINALTY